MVSLGIVHSLWISNIRMGIADLSSYMAYNVVWATRGVLAVEKKGDMEKISCMNNLAYCNDWENLLGNLGCLVYCCPLHVLYVLSLFIRT